MKISRRQLGGDREMSSRQRAARAHARRDGRQRIAPIRRLAMALALLLVMIALLPSFVSPAAWALGESMGMIKSKGLAPAFTLPGMDGKSISLENYRGRVVLLNFWATWCPPCRLEMPSMRALYDQYKERGLTILAVSIDKHGAQIVKPFLDKHKLNFPVALDKDMKVMDQYGVRGLPSTIIIDARGRKHGIIVGPRDWHGKEAKQLVEEMLAKLMGRAAK